MLENAAASIMSATLMTFRPAATSHARLVRGKICNRRCCISPPSRPRSSLPRPAGERRRARHGRFNPSPNPPRPLLLKRFTGRSIGVVAGPKTAMNRRRPWTRSPVRPTISTSRQCPRPRRAARQSPILPPKHRRPTPPRRRMHRRRPSRPVSPSRRPTRHYLPRLRASRTARACPTIWPRFIPRAAISRCACSRGCRPTLPS